MSLQHPGFLLLGLLVPLALWFGLRRGAPAVRFTPGRFLDGLPKTWRVRLLPLPRLMQVAGLLLATVALARPVQSIPLPHTTKGIDIVLCLDTSSSMTANDLDPRRTRLEVAKEAAARFIAGRPEDRVGLVTFARFPDLRCPPTRDHEALASILADVVPVSAEGPEDATGIGAAVARAAQVLGGGGAPDSRVVVLLTDGDENVATADKPGEIAPLHAGQLCRKLGVRVYAIAAGLGSRDRSGRWVAIDTGQVRGLAERTGGRLFEARDAGAVAGVYSEIDKLEAVEFIEPRLELVERFLPFLVAAVSLIAGALLLRSTLLLVLP